MTEVIRGRYQLMDKLGQGGFGAVWRAHDNTLNREVAVKVLNLANENQEEMVARFKTESQVASSFEHQNILRVYDFGQDENGRCFLVSELLKGVSLHEQLKSKEPLPLELSLDVLYQVSSALEVAHSQKTVHRDIKPPNIFLNKPMKGPGFVKLLDFGIAKVIGGKQESLTVTGQIMGTPHYMSPEQIVNIKLVDHRSDIYSLGIVFYQMLTGKVPFDDESYFAIMKHQMQSPMPKLSLPQYSSNLVGDLQEILKLMTHKDVRKRVEDIKGILEHIERIWHVYSVSSNAMTTGSFRSMSSDSLPYLQTSSRTRNVEEGMDQMLEPFNGADALIDDMFESAMDEPAANDLSTEDHQSTNEPKKSLLGEASDTPATDSATAPPTKKIDHHIQPTDEPQAQSAEETEVAEVAEVVESGETEEHVKLEEQVTTFSPTPFIKSQSQKKIFMLGAVAFIGVGLAGWLVTQFSSNDSDHLLKQSVALEQTTLAVESKNEKNSQDRLDHLGSSIPQTELDTQRLATKLVVDQGMETQKTLIVVQDAEVLEADMSVSVASDMGMIDQGLIDAEVKKVDQEVETQKVKSVKKARIKASRKKSPRRKKVKKRKKPKIKGKIKIIPDGVSYDVGQQVRLRFPKSTKGLKSQISLGSCAKWVSKSSYKIKFIGTGKCTLKACYGKKCIKSDVINVIKPLF